LKFILTFSNKNSVLENNISVCFLVKTGGESEVEDCFNLYDVLYFLLKCLVKTTFSSVVIVYGRSTFCRIKLFSFEILSRAKMMP